MELKPRKEAERQLMKKRNIDNMNMTGKDFNGEKKKISTPSFNTSSQPALQSRASFGKALHKSLRALPASPRKRRAVVQDLARRVANDLSNNMTAVLNTPKSQSGKNYEIVKEFFFRADIVYTCPGIKDKITVWENGKKYILAKYYMTMYLREAFAIFQAIYPDVLIGFSKFCSLRPPNVKLLKDTPADQCKCKIHENFFLQLKGLKVSYDNIWGILLCNTEINSPCWQNKCGACANGKRLNLPLDPEEQVSWKHWENNMDERLNLAVKEGCAAELHETIIQNMPQVMQHVNVKRIQAEEFQNDKKNESGTRILKIDFAMSFSCEYQQEVQSALWSRNSIILFTAATFLDGKCHTYLLCSDIQNKKKTIFAMLSVLYDKLYSNDSSPIKEEEGIWSDGPASEFKNRYMVNVLRMLFEKFTRLFTWKYFATSHGKGVIDGIGCNVNQLVHHKIMAQSEQPLVIQRAAEFAAVTQQVVASTTANHITENEIQRTLANENPWKNIVAVPGVSK